MKIGMKEFIEDIIDLNKFLRLNYAIQNGEISIQDIKDSLKERIELLLKVKSDEEEYEMCTYLLKEINELKSMGLI